MMVVLLALASAATFGAMTVAIRAGIRDSSDAMGAALATMTVAFAVVLAASLVRHDYSGAWRFFLAGLLAPGISQLLFTMSVREVGASRTSVAVGAAPLFALVLAFALLGEPVRVPLVVGGLAIVGGGILLASERDRPDHLRRRGLFFALGAAVLFAVRDNIIRALHAHGSPETVAAATMLAGMLVALAFTRAAPTGRQLRHLAPAGLLFGVSYVCLFEAYFHGRVSVVSPLVATESLWGVGLAALYFRGTEGVGRRVVFGAVAIVAGGVLIGVAAGTS
jgi:drug/metabolite transporter (DMT)-like permease